MIKAWIPIKPGKDKDSGEIVGDKFEEDEFISDHIECKLKMNIQEAAIYSMSVDVASHSIDTNI